MSLHDDLLLRFRQGDGEAFDDLVALMAPRLFGFFRRLGATAALAEDLTQDVFMRVLHGLDRYAGQGRLEAFLFQVARNRWIDHTRKRRESPLLEEHPEQVVELPPDADLLTRDRDAWLRAKVGKLDADTKELLELAILQDLPYREVALILDIPLGTVKSRVFYALRKLRESLAGREDLYLD